MERLIDANELYKLPCVHGAEGTWICLEDIRNIPTASAVEVVKCKDCKFYSEDEKWCRRLGLCGAFNKNDFCSHGEREDEID